MSEPKTFASLGPTLLARKGGARPAMRAQIHALPQHGADPAAFEDLGWNDMGDEPDELPASNILPLTPPPANSDADAESDAIDRVTAAELAEAAKPAIRHQQEGIADRLAQPVPIRPAAQRPRRSALDDGRRAAFTLRLDSERHLKLRLASTIRNRSAQHLVTEALDQLLDAMPELASLASQVKRN